MANTTFNGPVRSENGFEAITKNTSTGVVTKLADLFSAPRAELKIDQRGRQPGREHVEPEGGGGERGEEEAEQGFGDLHGVMEGTFLGA